MRLVASDVRGPHRTACFRKGSPILMSIRSFLTVLLLLVAAPAWAQFDTAAVVGTVHDPSGSVVPGATVTMTNTATSVSASRTTNAEGVYEFVTVRPGLY